MKIFDSSMGNWGDKVNFVDEENVFVGYDTGQKCCEHADWIIANKIVPYKDMEFDWATPNTEGYIFDTKYFNEIDEPDSDVSVIAFKLIHQDQVDLYLHIFNVHNGYYYHGFTFKDGDKVIQEGEL